MQNHKNCKVLDKPDSYSLEVVQCNDCGFHLGIDGSYLEQVGSIELNCPSCGILLLIPGIE